MAHSHMLIIYGMTIITSGCYTSLVSASTEGGSQESPCPDPSPPKNGSVFTWGHGLLVEYVCDQGMFPIGPSFGSCDTVRKRWSIRKPKCVF